MKKEVVYSILAFALIVISACDQQVVPTPQPVQLDYSCTQDSDCAIVNINPACTSCSPCGAPDYGQPQYIAARPTNYQQYRLNYWKTECPNFYNCKDKPLEDECIEMCPDCLPTNDLPNYVAKCISNTCQKVPSEVIPENAVDITQGVYGKALYGQGDCMPPINERTRQYNLYDGMMYVLDSQAAMSGAAYTEEQLINLSTAIRVTDGSFAKSLEPGGYYAFVGGVSTFSTEFFFEVKPNQRTKEEFKFFKCESY